MNTITRRVTLTVRPEFELDVDLEIALEDEGTGNIPDMQPVAKKALYPNMEEARRLMHEACDLELDRMIREGDPKIDMALEKVWFSDFGDDD